MPAPSAGWKFVHGRIPSRPLSILVVAGLQSVPVAHDAAAAPMTSAVPQVSPASGRDFIEKIYLFPRRVLPLSAPGRSEIAGQRQHQPMTALSRLGRWFPRCYPASSDAQRDRFRVKWLVCRTPRSAVTVSDGEQPWHTWHGKMNSSLMLQCRANVPPTPTRPHLLS